VCIKLKKNTPCLRAEEIIYDAEERGDNCNTTVLEEDHGAGFSQ
jgi:hypothetical protein